MRAGTRLENRITFVVANVRDRLPFSTRAYDLVFCLGLLETVSGPAEQLRELVRTTAPGGRLVLSLYRGRASLVAALNRGWYERYLATHDCHIEVVLPLRRSQDVLVIRRNKAVRR